MLIDGELTEKIIGAAMKVHSALGPGLLESAYEACLAFDLARQGLGVQKQVAVPLKYDGVTLDCGFKIDLLVERRVVVELKAVDRFEPVHEAQLITYLKLSGHRTGLLMNLKVAALRDGIIRRVV